jgi:hypothetical protein
VPPPEASRIPPVPAILELSLDMGAWSDYRSLITPVEDVDFLYRVAAATYGTTLPRRRVMTWPPPRPLIRGLRYGSPLEVTFAVDLQTFFTGAGFGTGVVGLGALLRWAYGLDLDFRIHRAERVGELARIEADRLEDENRQMLAAAERRRLSDGSSDERESPLATPMPYGPKAAVTPAPRSGLDGHELIALQAERVEWIVRTEKSVRQGDEPLRGLAGRLWRVGGHGNREGRARAILRDVTKDEAKALGLPTDGSVPHLPDLRREYHD